MAKSRFKKLTDSQIEYIKSVYHTEMSSEEKLQILTDLHGVSSKTIRSWWRKFDLKSTPTKLPKQLIRAWDREVDDDVDVLFVTSAQNRTVIHKAMLTGMKIYAEYLYHKFGVKVQIVVIPSRYRNPTSPVESTVSEDDMWWDMDVEEHLHYSEIKFGDATIDAMARIRPTAKMPLAGYEPNANNCHYVLGHPRMHTKVLPRFKGDPLWTLSTTGFLSRKNYSKSKSGDLAKRHHTYGFLVIEKREDGKCYVPRGVKVNNDGTFTDYKYHYNGSKIKKIKQSEAYILGDIHHRELNQDKYKSSLNVIDDTNPKKIVLHDLFDGSTVNPHEKRDLFIRKLKIREGLHLIEEEIHECVEFLDDLRDRVQGVIYVIQSNHDDFLDRYINDENWKADLHNSVAYHKYAILQQTKDLRKYGNIFGCIIAHQFGEDVQYIKNTEPLKIGTYQCGYHGHHGINGSRGSVNAFKRLNTKMIHGHVHTPQMCDGVTAVGVSCNLWQYYNSNGMSSWAYADSIVHSSGKNQLLIFDDHTKQFTNFR